MNNILELPEDCLSKVLSLTSPLDVLRSSAVSKQFLAVSDSDTVWNNFLPSDYDDIIYGVSRDRAFASKKDLFMHLSHFPLLLDNSTKSFGLEKRSGKICYMLGSRALSIVWGSSPQYWRWKSVPGSRFPECAVLINVCWLQIKGTIETRLLSPSTTYGIYFVFKLEDVSYRTGFGKAPVKVSVSQISEDAPDYAIEIKSLYLEAPDSDDESEEEDNEEESLYSLMELPIVRDDGWEEIEMGRYQAGVNDGDERVMLEMSLKEVERGHWKEGLVVHGIELRPLS